MPRKFSKRKNIVSKTTAKKHSPVPRKSTAVANQPSVRGTSNARVEEFSRQPV